VLRGLKQEQRYEIGGIILMALGALAFLGLFSDATGPVGQFFDRVLHHLLGRAAPAVPTVIVLMGLVYITRRGIVRATPRFAGLLLMLALLPVYFHLQIPPGMEFEALSLAEGGGLVGAGLSWALVTGFGIIGRAIILAALSVVAVLLTTSVSISDIASWLTRGGAWGLAMLKRAGSIIYTYISEPVEAEADLVIHGIVEQPEHTADSGEVSAEEVIESLLPEEKDEETSSSSSTNGKTRLTRNGKQQDETSVIFEQIRLDTTAAYQFPPLSLLKAPTLRGGFRSRQRVRQQSKLLEETLGSFGIEAKVREISQGPAVTRFELEPAPGVKVSRVVNLANDIALSLAATDVRVVAPIPGKALIGIEVPNKHVAAVHIRATLEEPAFQRSGSQLTIALGQEISGSAVITTMDRLVHLLIAGATGSGKSVCINSIICSLLYKAHPDQVKLVLVDPKVVELSQYDGIPHLLAPVITDPKKAAGVLQWLVREMESRYRKFGKAGVRDIDRYNRQLDSRDAPRSERLPYIVLIIDELADLMAVAPVDVEDAIQRLAQMARAAGIHLIIATQRPSVDVITGVIKANIPSRIAFAVSSQTDSRVILDTGGAEKLVGKGDMLFMPVGSTKPIRVQGSYVSEEETKDLIDFVTRQGEPEFEDNILKEAEGSSSPYADFDDELFPDALRCVIESGQASVSMLQRRFRVGYTRAGRLIDMMEQRGYIGPHQGSKPRDVIMTMEQYRQLFEAEEQA